MTSAPRWRGPARPCRAVWVAALAAACEAGTRVAAPAPVAAVRLSPDSVTLGETDSVTLAAALTDANGTPLSDRPVAWASTLPAVATVSSRGVVTAHAQGVTWIIATAGQAADSARARVVVRFASLTAGFSHTCAVTTNGRGYCWGEGSGWRRGDGTTRLSTVPVPVGTPAEFSMIRAGWEHTCGLTRGIARAFCWGTNRAGQVGTLTKTDAAVPEHVAVEETFLAIATGERHTCGVAGERRAVCWGANWAGQLGTGEVSGSGLLPRHVAESLRFRAIGVGWYFTCGLVEEGAAYCWGANDAGQLGRVTTGATCALPGTGPEPCEGTPQRVTGGHVFGAIATGGRHACGVATDGSAFCWGANDRGQVGDGTRTAAAAPVPVAGGLRWQLLAAGFAHTCGVATDDAAYCWGSNVAGELGTDAQGQTCGGPPCAMAPIAVKAATGFRSLSAGGMSAGGHTCGIDVDGMAFCWGRNHAGQLGNGSLEESSLPVRVAGQR